ncbi:MAG: hypothetical protein EOP11_17305 [Proteobacteria bacterium]|nr:MAG: hypothetical protein EOP11_17305 [Pseudomonadota bacterium]
MTGAFPTVAKATGLLILSNIFMTFAWYGHLKYKSKPLLIVILVSWGIAFFEYCLQVPANRMGSDVMSASQLKVLQEVITFTVFGIFSFFYLSQSPTRYDLVAFGLIVAAVAVSLFQPGAAALGH